MASRTTRLVLTLAAHLHPLTVERCYSSAAAAERGLAVIQRRGLRLTETAHGLRTVTLIPWHAVSRARILSPVDLPRRRRRR